MKNMKSRFLILFVFIISNVISARNDHCPFAAGIMIGDPTGISLKMQSKGGHALAGGMGWSMGKNAHLNLHMDFLKYHSIIVTPEDRKFLFYYGIGSRIRIEDESRLGIRFPLGINYRFRSAPFETFFELVPVFDLAPETSTDLGAGIGIRYCF